MGSSSDSEGLTDLNGDVQGDRTMVATHRLVADLAVAQAWHQTRGQNKVIEPPADVLLASAHHVGPEGVGVLLLGVELAEAVGEARLQQLTKALPLLRGEAGILLVAFGVLQVDLLVRDVEVAAQHHGLLDVELAQVRAEVLVPGLAVVQTHEASARVWYVRCHQVEVGELCSDDAALLVMLFLAWINGIRGLGPHQERKQQNPYFTIKHL